MRYPNLRYGNPEMLRFYSAGRPIQEIARVLRRDVRSVRDWQNGKKKVPFWVPELLRLYQMEHDHRIQYMTGKPVPAQLAIARGTVLHFPDTFALAQKKALDTDLRSQSEANIKSHNDAVLMAIAK